MKTIYKVGELVEVLDKQTVERIYGVDSFGDMDTPHGIVPQMESALGNTFEIKKIDKDDLGEYVELVGYETWRFDIGIIRRIAPRPNDKVIIKGWEHMLKEFGLEAMWVDTDGNKMVSMGKTSFNYKNMHQLCGTIYTVLENEAFSDDRVDIGLDWYITKDMLYVINRPLPKMTLADIEVGKPIPDELCYTPKLKSEIATDKQQSIIEQTMESIDFTPLEISNADSPKEIVVFDGAIELNGISISGKEIQIKFK